MKYALPLLLSTTLALPVMAQESDLFADPYLTADEYVAAYCIHRQAFFDAAANEGISILPVNEVDVEKWVMEDFVFLVSTLGVQVLADPFIPTPNMCV